MNQIWNFERCSQVAGLVRSYLGDTDPKNPPASPLYGDISGLPLSEFMLETMKYCLTTHAAIERAVVAGVDARLDVWMGMPPGGVQTSHRKSWSLNQMKTVAASVTIDALATPIGVYSDSRQTAMP